MNEKSNWNFVDLFTVHQAACLWCNLNPAKIPEVFSLQHPSEVVAAMQLLVSAINTGTLILEGDCNAFSYINNYTNCYLKRSDLIDFANAKGMRPKFLFDTILPIEDHLPKSASSAFGDDTVQAGSAIKNQSERKRGRPQEYDWDSFIFEIIKRANSPDGLPETQAELVRIMLQWFLETAGGEPAESSVKSRISKIYRYLNKAEKS